MYGDKEEKKEEEGTSFWRSVECPPPDDYPDEVVNMRLKSVYAAPVIEILLLKDKTTLTIPEPLFSKFDKLCVFSAFSDKRLNIALDVGHILAHYLFTDTYQCLKPKGLTVYERLTAEYTTSIRVYIFARKYAIRPLEELSKCEIERLGRKLRLSVVLDLIREEYPYPSADDVWFRGYLRSHLKALLEDPAKLEDCVTADFPSDKVPVGELLFKDLVTLIRDRSISSHTSTALLAEGNEEAPSVTVPESRKELETELELKPKVGEATVFDFLRQNPKNKKRAVKEPEPEPEDPNLKQTK